MCCVAEVKYRKFWGRKRKAVGTTERPYHAMNRDVRITFFSEVMKISEEPKRNNYLKANLGAEFQTP